MLRAAPAPAAAGRLAMQCRQSRAVHAGQACAPPQRRQCHLRCCHSSAKPFRLHAHAQHDPSSSNGSGSASSSRRRSRHDAAAAVSEVRLHSAKSAVGVCSACSDAISAGTTLEQHPAQSVQSVLSRPPIARLLDCRAHLWLTATLQLITHHQRHRPRSQPLSHSRTAGSRQTLQLAARSAASDAMTAIRCACSPSASHHQMADTHCATAAVQR
jgi:hypothetical protein